jgi:Cdc6-like AAA superfamily ATPase
MPDALGPDLSLVGSRRFEPGGLTVPKSRRSRPWSAFSRVLSSFRHGPWTQRACFSHQDRLNYYTNYYMKDRPACGTILTSAKPVPRKSRNTPLTTLLHEALFVVYRNIVVSRLREVLTPDEVASASRPEVREEQIAHHELIAPIQDVYSVVDLGAANHLVNHFARRLLPPSQGRAAQELLETELRRDLKKIRLWRDPVAHPTESNSPKPHDAIGSIEAAQRVLDRLGLDSHALERFAGRIRGSDRAARKALASEESHALPAKMRLYGRDRDLEELCTLMTSGDTNLVTVTGAGGTGKTSIAIEAVRKVASHLNRRVRFIRLETFTQEGQVLTQINRAIGLPRQSGDEQRLIAELRAKPAILLLDNLEQALDAAALLGRVAARCDQSVFIATSRERLGIKHERVFSLPTLAIPAPDDSIGDIRFNPSVQVFVQRLEAGRGKYAISNAEYLDIAAMVRELDGLCLAIELIAAQTIDRSIASVRRQIPRLLALPVADPTLPERHRTLMACLKWSWDLATKDEQTLLKRMMHIFGEFTRGTLDGMCLDLGFKSTDDVSAAAVRRNLLRKSHDGYLILEPVRQFLDGQVNSNDRQSALATLLTLATWLAELLPAEDAPETEHLIEVFRIGSNALVLLEGFPTMVNRDQALVFLLSWCPMTWRFGPVFGRWDEELVAMLARFARHRRGTPSKLVTRGLIELARLHNHYERRAESRRCANAALLEALALDDVALARASIVVVLEATVGNQRARRQLMARLIRGERTEALNAAIWTLAVPDETFASPDTVEAAPDIELAVAGLHTIAAGHIAAGDHEAAANALFHSQWLLDSYGAGQRSLWKKQAELAKRSSDLFTFGAALISSACDLLGLSDDLWDVVIFDVTNRRDNLPVVESAEGKLEELVIRWPTGRREIEMRQLLKQANATTLTFEAAALLAALSIRTHDHGTFESCVRDMTDSPLTDHRHALVLAAFGIWTAKAGNIGASARIITQLIGWLASRGNQMAAFALQAKLTEAGVKLPRRRWRLGASEKTASLAAVRGMTREQIVEFAEAEIIRIKRRDEAKSRRDRGLRPL